MPDFHFTTPRTARYEQRGTLSADTKELWLVCHGYGSLATYFVRHFAWLADDDPSTVVVAPEGLSRFYLQGTSGRVGASWMTSDDRLSEIADHVAYLESLTRHLLAQCGPAVQLMVVGFSQGTATVSRWLAQTGRRPAHLVLWAGDFPADIDPAAATHLLSGLRLTLVAGDSDGYFGPEKLAQQTEYLSQLGGQPTVRTFEGHHELKRPVIRRLAGR
jgi:predicted esterase